MMMPEMREAIVARGLQYIVTFVTTAEGYTGVEWDPIDISEGSSNSPKYRWLSLPVLPDGGCSDKSAGTSAVVFGNRRPESATKNVLICRRRRHYYIVIYHRSDCIANIDRKWECQIPNWPIMQTILTSLVIVFQHTHHSDMFHWLLIAIPRSRQLLIAVKCCTKSANNIF